MIQIYSCNHKKFLGYFRLITVRGTKKSLQSLFNLPPLESYNKELDTSYIKASTIFSSVCEHRSNGQSWVLSNAGKCQGDAVVKLC
jgi:hypothetical protein